MSIRKLNFKLLCAALAVTSCTAVRLTTFKDPDFAKRRFKKTAIVADLGDLERNRRVEARVIQVLSEEDAEAVAGSLLLLPTRTYSRQEQDSLFAAYGIDGCVSIKLLEYGTIAVEAGAAEQVFCEFHVLLREIESGRVAWVADSHARNRFTTAIPEYDLNRLLDTFAEKLARKLLDEGLVQYASKPK
ncbi:MAG: hypothetical protein ONB12_13915 [candidate division KSB1 bacterium]|nr:hypothetical protein [candidate division KSB1 bacterium]